MSKTFQITFYNNETEELQHYLIFLWPKNEKLLTYFISFLSSVYSSNSQSTRVSWWNRHPKLYCVGVKNQTYSSMVSVSKWAYDDGLVEINIRYGTFSFIWRPDKTSSILVWIWQKILSCFRYTNSCHRIL